MSKITLDWFEYCLFLMIANAESTDYYLTEEEIVEILSKAKKLDSKFTREEVLKKFNIAFERYNYIGETAQQGKMNAAILNEVKNACIYLQEQPWFTTKFAQNILNDLIAVAKVDDLVIKKEKQLINEVALQWKLKKPFKS